MKKMAVRLDPQSGSGFEAGVLRFA